MSAELAGLALPSTTMTSSTDDEQVLMLPGVLRTLGATLEDRDDGARELLVSVRDKAGTSLTEGGEIDLLALR